MRSVDYFHYKEVYAGNELSEYEFLTYRQKACDYVSAITLRKAETYTEDDSVKNLVCAITEAYCRHENYGNVKSADVDGMSVTFENPKSFDDELMELTQRYLIGTNLLYRGGR